MALKDSLNLTSLASPQLEALLQSINGNCEVRRPPASSHSSFPSQAGLSLFQELGRAGTRLQEHLSLTGALLGSYLGTLQQLADCAAVSEGRMGGHWPEVGGAIVES